MKYINKINIEKICIIFFILGGIVLAILKVKGWGWLLVLAFFVLILRED
jgi:hypothetical protein